MSRRAFTLIEVLVALVVLGVGLLALAKMSIVYVRATNQSHQSSEGVLLAQDKMENCGSTPSPTSPATTRSSTSTT